VVAESAVGVEVQAGFSAEEEVGADPPLGTRGLTLAADLELCHRERGSSVVEREREEGPVREEEGLVMERGYVVSAQYVGKGKDTMRVWTCGSEALSEYIYTECAIGLRWVVWALKWVSIIRDEPYSVPPRLIDFARRFL